MCSYGWNSGMKTGMETGTVVVQDSVLLLRSGSAYTWRAVLDTQLHLCNRISAFGSTCDSLWFSGLACVFLAKCTLPFQVWKLVILTF
jgi:hypothetical protein